MELTCAISLSEEREGHSREGGDEAALDRWATRARPARLPGTAQSLTPNACARRKILQLRRAGGWETAGQESAPPPALNAGGYGMPPRVELGYGAGAVPGAAEPGSGPAHAALPGEGVIEVEGPEDGSGDSWPDPPAGKGDGAESGRADAGAQPAEMPGGAEIAEAIHNLEQGKLFPRAQELGKTLGEPALRPSGRTCSETRRAYCG